MPNFQASRAPPAGTHPEWRSRMVHPAYPAATAHRGSTTGTRSAHVLSVSADYDFTAVRVPRLGPSCSMKGHVGISRMEAIINGRQVHVTIGQNSNHETMV